MEKGQQEIMENQIKENGDMDTGSHTAPAPSGTLNLQESMKALIRAEHNMESVTTALTKLREDFENGDVLDDDFDIVEIYRSSLQGQHMTQETENKKMEKFITELTDNDEEMMEILGQSSNQIDQSNANKTT